MGNKSANNKFKFKHGGTKMKGNATDGGTILATCGGSGIDIDMTIQYRGSIEKGKGMSESVDIVNQNNIRSIGRYKSDILSREGVIS